MCMRVGLGAARACGTCRRAVRVSTRRGPVHSQRALTTMGGKSGGVVWLHGLGDSGAGWADVAIQLAAPLPHLAWKFPDAPIQGVTVNAGYEMPSWFDLAALPVTPATPHLDPSGLDRSCTRVLGIADALAAELDVPTSRIVIGGFSQGGALALQCALRSTQPLGGVVVFSGWTAFPSESEEALRGSGSAALGWPYLLAHGTQDDKVDVSCHAATAKMLKDLGAADVTERTYPMGHSACPEELQDLAAFLARTLPPTGKE